MFISAYSVDTLHLPEVEFQQFGTAIAGTDRDAGAVGSIRVDPLCQTNSIIGKKIEAAASLATASIIGICV